MKFVEILILVVLISGCVQQSHNQNTSTFERASDELEIRSETNGNARVVFLKRAAQLSGMNLDKFYEADSLFSVMRDLRNGEVTTTDLTDSLFYFKDRVGTDTGNPYRNTYFKCIQVFETGEQELDTGEMVASYSALYSNFQIDITIAVFWLGTRPLKGQRLNVDFLVYFGADTYKNKDGEDRSRVIFARPIWAFANGFSPELEHEN